MENIIIEQQEYYQCNLRNYSTVCKDTNNAILNHDDLWYNCFGYAVGTYQWEDCDDFTDYTEIDCDDLTDEEMLYNNLNTMADYVLATFPTVREISNIKEATTEERVFALRVGLDDFHFARLGSDGIWTHKPGSGTVREMSEEEFHGIWCEGRPFEYYSDIIYFAIKEAA